MFPKLIWTIFFINVFAISIIKCDTYNKIEKERERYSKIMASYMDPKSKPCDNFYQYACGNYFNVNKRPGVKYRDTFTFMEFAKQEDIHKILMEPVTTVGAENAISVTDKARLVYQSCMKVDLFSYPKSETYLKLIESLGGWPVLHENWNPEHFDWFNVTLEGLKYKINTFLDVTYFGVSKSLSIFSGYSFRGIHHAVLFKPSSPKYQTAKKIATTLMMAYGATEKAANVAFSEIVEFAKEWNELSINLERDNAIFTTIPEDDEEQEGLELLIKLTLESNLFDRFEKRVTVGELYELIPEIDFKTVLKTYFETDIDPTQNITISVPEYYKQISELFRNKKYAKGIANYAFLIFLYDLHNEYHALKYQKSFCYKEVTDVFNDVIAYLYLHSSYYDRSSEKDILEIFTTIKNTFKDTITSVDWLDEQTKQRAISKGQAIIATIGDSNHTLNIDELTEEYKKLPILPTNNYYENKLEIRKFKRWQKVHPEEYKYKYEISINAGYGPLDNKIDLNAGIVRKPLYYRELPKSYNFGGLGVVLAHEVMHAFDPKSRERNEEGKPENWWSEKSSNEYQKRIQCLIDQYSNLTSKNSPTYVDGAESITEITADNGGIRQGYYAYEKWLKDHGISDDDPSEVLPNLNLSNKQLFFLSTAQAFCTDSIKIETQKDGSDLFYSEAHYDGIWRINAGLSNFDEFSKTFNCAANTKMNPQKKCVVW